MATEETEIEATEDEGEVYRIPVVKAKHYLEVRTGSNMPDHVYREALILGFKQLLNRGQTKITKEAYPDPEQLRKVAMEKAEETLAAMYSGKIRVVGGKAAGKVPGVVMTEARRLARASVKQALKDSGVRVSLVEASEITKAANALIATDPTYIQMAEEELEKRAKAKLPDDIISGIQISQKKLKAQEAKRAEKVLSAAKSGQVAARKPGRPNLNA